MAIFGAGPIGALALVLAKLRGVPRVCVIDVNAERLAVARTLGADLVVDGARPEALETVRSWSEGRGADHVVEAVGIEATRRAAVAASAKGGRLLFLGLAQNDSTLPWIEMTRNEQAVFTSFAYTPRDFEAAVGLVESRRFDLKPWTETRGARRGSGQLHQDGEGPGLHPEADAHGVETPARASAPSACRRSRRKLQ